MRTELIALIKDVWQVLHDNIDWMSWNLFLAFVPLDLSISLFHAGQRGVDAQLPSPRVAPVAIKRWVWWLRCLIFLVLLPNIRYVLTSAHLLAVLPLALSYWLFNRERFHSSLWWLGFLVFFAFLPNAPYVLTDIIHFYSDIRTINSVWLNTLVVLPVYLLFIFAGFAAYVFSLINFGYYLQRIGKSDWILGAELVTHALCAVGIYLGRFLRFNSWDFITQPDALATSVLEDLLGKRPVVIIAITFVIIAGLYWGMKRMALEMLLPKNGAIAKRHSPGKTDFSNS